jgi:hypothetical protein
MREVPSVGKRKKKTLARQKENEGNSAGCARGTLVGDSRYGR